MVNYKQNLHFYEIKITGKGHLSMHMESFIRYTDRLASDPY